MVPKMIKQELDLSFSDQALVICGVFLQPLFSDFGFQADAAGMIPFSDQRRKILGGVCNVPVRDPADGRTAGKVSRLGVGVQHIRGTFRYKAA